MAKYRIYVVSRKVWCDCEIVKKGFLNLGKRIVYNIHGVNDDGHKACANVAKDVWDRFNVPIVEYTMREKEQRGFWEKTQKGKKTYRYPIQKSRKKVQNEEIERWLTEKYDLDLDKPNQKNSLL